MEKCWNVGHRLRVRDYFGEFAGIIKKAAMYKFFRIGYAKGLGVNIFLVEKWINKAIDISKARDKKLVIKTFVANIPIVYSLKSPKNLWF